MISNAVRVSYCKKKISNFRSCGTAARQLGIYDGIQPECTGTSRGLPTSRYRAVPHYSRDRPSVVVVVQSTFGLQLYHSVAVCITAVKSRNRVTRAYIQQAVAANIHTTSTGTSYIIVNTGFIVDSKNGHHRTQVLCTTKYEYFDANYSAPGILLSTHASPLTLKTVMTQKTG